MYWTIDGMSWLHSEEAANEVVSCLERYLKNMKADDPNIAIVKDRIEYWKSERQHAHEKLEIFHDAPPEAELFINRERLLKIAVEATLHLRKGRDIEKYRTLRAAYNKVKSEWVKFGLAKDFDISQLKLTYKKKRRSFEDFAHKCRIFALDPSHIATPASSVPISLPTRSKR